MQNVCPIGSAVLTFIGYKQTDTQTKYVYRFLDSPTKGQTTQGQTTQGQTTQGQTTKGQTTKGQKRDKG